MTNTPLATTTILPRLRRAPWPSSRPSSSRLWPRTWVWSPASTAASICVLISIALLQALYSHVGRQQPPQQNTGMMACLAGMCLCCCAEGMSFCWLLHDHCSHVVDRALLSIHLSCRIEYCQTIARRHSYWLSLLVLWTTVIVTSGYLLSTQLGSRSLLRRSAYGHDVFTCFYPLMHIMK